MHSQSKAAQYILWILACPFVLWAAAVLAYAFAEKASLSDFINIITACMNDPFSIQWVENTGSFLLAACVLYPAGIAAYYAGQGNRRPGEEHGSARWGSARALDRKYRDRKRPENNIILTRQVQLGLDGRITRRNAHQLVVGGSGAGKTRFFCLPNCLTFSLSCSQIVCDPKGEILRSIGGLLEAHGIPFTVLDLVNMRGHYNPFVYLRKDSDVLKLVTNLIANTTPKGSKSNDPFWGATRS